jgi:hypothetical protein
MKKCKHGHHVGRLQLVLTGEEGMGVSCPSLVPPGREEEREEGDGLGEGRQGKVRGHM